MGKPITTDKMTLTKERISFARVLVEVDVKSEFVSVVEVGLPTGVVYHQSVIPEFTPKFCKKCKTFGHVEGTCGKGLEERQQKAYVAMKKSLARGGDGAGLVGLGGARAEDRSAPCPSATDVLAGDASRHAGVDANPGVSPLRPAVVGGGGGQSVGSGLGQVGAVLTAQVGAASGAKGKHVGTPVPSVAVAQGGQAADVVAAGLSGEGRSGQVGAGLLPALAEPGAPPSRPVVGLVTSGKGAAASGKGKKKKKGGQRDVDAAQPQSEGEDFQIESSPYDGLEASFEGWNKGGKKGKRK